MKNKNIIKKNYEFQQIINNRRFVGNESFVIYYNKNNLDTLRYGISVGKKIGNAVVRNKIKRQVRSMFFNLLKIYKNKSLNIILITKKKFLYKKYKENFDQLYKSFLKIA